MRKLIVLGVFVSLLVQAQGQLRLDIFGGFSNYQGDLQEKFFTTYQSRGAFGLGLRYNLTDHFGLRAGFTYGTIAAADKYSKKQDLKQRNLSFESKIKEASLVADYAFFDLESHHFTPYVFGGLAVFHFNPFAYDTLGNKTYLKPLSTEGEGLPQYPDRKPYRLTQLSVPMGIGIRWHFSDNVTLSYDLGLRKTFTDYLDDVSKSYVDPAILAAARGPKAVEMAYRGGELKNGSPYPAAGTVRGSPKSKDWYYFSGITISVGLGNSGSGSGGYGAGGRHKGRIDCPKKVS